MDPQDGSAPKKMKTNHVDENEDDTQPWSQGSNDEPLVPLSSGTSLRPVLYRRVSSGNWQKEDWSDNWPDCSLCEEYSANFECYFILTCEMADNIIKNKIKKETPCYRCAAMLMLHMPHKYTPLNIFYH